MFIVDENCFSCELFLLTGKPHILAHIEVIFQNLFNSVSWDFIVIFGIIINCWELKFKFWDSWFLNLNIYDGSVKSFLICSHNRANINLDWWYPKLPYLCTKSNILIFLVINDIIFYLISKNQWTTRLFFS